MTTQTATTDHFRTISGRLGDHDYTFTVGGKLEVGGYTKTLDEWWEVAETHFWDIGEYRHHDWHSAVLLGLLEFCDTMQQEAGSAPEGS